MRMIRTVHGNATYSSFKKLKNSLTEAIDAGAKCSVRRRKKIQHTGGNALCSEPMWIRRR